MKQILKNIVGTACLVGRCPISGNTYWNNNNLIEVPTIYNMYGDSPFVEESGIVVDKKIFDTYSNANEVYARLSNKARQEEDFDEETFIGNIESIFAFKEKNESTWEQEFQRKVAAATQPIHDSR